MGLLSGNCVLSKEGLGMRVRIRSCSSDFLLAHLFRKGSGTQIIEF